MVAGSLSLASGAEAATLTVCHTGCDYPTIQPAVTAAASGDTVEVREVETNTQQVTVNKPITLEGDPALSRPLLKFEPSSSNMPTLDFTSAAGGSMLEHMNVESDGSAVDDAVDFDAHGTITDVSATATGSAIYVIASDVTVGPEVAATSTGSGSEALEVLSTGIVTGVTALATGTNGAGGSVASLGPITDSTFSATGGGLSVGLVFHGGTARRVDATGPIGLVGNDALLTDSLVIGTAHAAVEADGGAALQLRNVTAISTAAGAPGVEALVGTANTSPGTIVAKNVIARGGPGGTDVSADTESFCGVSGCSTPGSVQIGYSNFVTASSTVDTTTIGHNQSGDPLFVDGTVGPSQDFHLQNDSPAIGAGTIDAQTGSSDLDGKPRPAAGQSEPSLGAYEPTGDALAVTLAGSGNGTVSGSGISCPGTCTKVYAAGTTVTLTAAPAPGSVFAGWAGACAGTETCDVTMSSEHSVTATFTAVAPSNTARPRISGTPTLSKILVGSNGKWTGGAVTFTYRWQDCDAAGNKCGSIAGATNRTYKLTAHDVGGTIRVVVTATEAGLSMTATSAHTAVVAGAPPALSHVHLSSSSFTARAGTTLRLTLSQSATVSVLVTQAQRGHIRKGRCTARAHHGRLCTLTVQKAELTLHGVLGSNRFTLLIRGLTRGRYMATITARAAGATSKPVKLNLTIEPS